MAYGLNGLTYLSKIEAQSHATENGRYQLQRELGRGAFGVVYKATDCDGAEVAIKVMSVKTTRSNLSLFSSLRGLKGAAEEAKTLSKLRNPYVIGFIHYYNFRFSRGRGAGIVTRYCRAEVLVTICSSIDWITRRGSSGVASFPWEFGSFTDEVWRIAI